MREVLKREGLAVLAVDLDLLHLMEHGSFDAPVIVAAPTSRSGQHSPTDSTRCPRFDATATTAGRSAHRCRFHRSC
ncbi:hypothetical protein N9Q18_00750 [bacterium]|nr:hypothetical protein [bacterium]